MAIWSKVETLLNVLVDETFKADLSLALVVGWFAFVELLLDETIEESEAEVEILGLNSSISKWDIEDKVFTTVRKSGVLVLEYAVLKCSLLNINISAGEVVVHDLFDILVRGEVERHVQFGDCSQDESTGSFIFVSTV